MILLETTQAFRKFLRGYAARLTPPPPPPNFVFHSSRRGHGLAAVGISRGRAFVCAPARGGGKTRKVCGKNVYKTVVKCKKLLKKLELFSNKY